MKNKIGPILIVCVIVAVAWWLLRSNYTYTYKYIYKDTATDSDNTNLQQTAEERVREKVAILRNSRRR